ncbi:hypothetical protein BC342_28955 [Streptomyces olivaceus]|nr:hypothetical protein BC342_28955 [Streptomyces olivaceus]
MPSRALSAPLPRRRADGGKCWVHGVNLDARFVSVAAFLPRFKSRGGRSHILNTSSISGLIAMAGVAAYTSSKFASVGLSMALREELAGTDVGVSQLVPGAVATAINFNAGAAEAQLFGREMDTAIAEKNSALLFRGADPGRVGEQVVEAMQQEQIMVVTHREWGPSRHVRTERRACPRRLRRSARSGPRSRPPWQSAKRPSPPESCLGDDATAPCPELCCGRGRDDPTNAGTPENRLLET